jgi:hypothetical protein
MSALGLRTYRVYGLRLESDYSFSARLLETAGPADVSLLETSGQRSESTASPRLVWESELRNTQGEIAARLYREGNREVLSFTDAADFYIDGFSVGYRVGSVDNWPRMEASFLATVVALLRERQGVLAIHASAVSCGKEAVAFMAASGTGKSTLAAAFLTRGWSLVTDDVLAVDPGYPEIKLGPAYGRKALGSSFDDEHTLIEDSSPKRRIIVGESGFGRFESAECTLRHVFVLSRSSLDENEAVSVVEVAGSDLVWELLRFSFTPRLAQATGLAEERLSRLVEMSHRIPITRLVIPSSIERVGGVVDAVEGYLETAAKTDRADAQ